MITASTALAISMALARLRTDESIITYCYVHPGVWSFLVTAHLTGRAMIGLIHTPEKLQKDGIYSSWGAAWENRQETEVSLFIILTLPEDLVVGGESKYHIVGTNVYREHNPKSSRRSGG